MEEEGGGSALDGQIKEEPVSGTLRVTPEMTQKHFHWARKSQIGHKGTTILMACSFISPINGRCHASFAVHTLHVIMYFKI